MLNVGKYRSQILEFSDNEKTMYFSFKNDNANMLNSCHESNCNYYALYSLNDKCSITRMKWLLSKYMEPIKLTRLEFEILKWLDKGGYKFIVRSPNDNLMAHDSIPKKVLYGWISENRYKILTSFNDLLHFIKYEDEQPTLIQEVLEICEVIEDD